MADESGVTVAAGATGEGGTGDAEGTSSMDNAQHNTDNKGQYEELSVDEGQQFEIDDILDAAPASTKKDGSLSDDKLLEHFKDDKEADGEKGEKAEGDVVDNKPTVKPEQKASKDDGDGEDPVVTAMRATILELTEKLDAVTKGTAEPKGKEKEGEDKEDGSAPVEFPPINLESLGIKIDDDSFDQLFESKDAFNAILSDVAAKTAEVTATRIYTTLPRIINTMVASQVAIGTKSSKLYADNPDLKAHAKFVGKVADQIVAEHPDWPIDKVFEEIPGTVRTKLGLKAKGSRQDEIAAKKRPVAAPRGTGVRPISDAMQGKGKDGLTPMQKEINDLIS